MEIIPNRGIGSIHFGMTASDVKAVMGDELVWEKWMGANLNADLYYAGIVICFKPILRGKIIEIWIGSTFNATYKGLAIFNLDVEDIKLLLENEGVPYSLTEGSDIVGIHVKEYNLSFSFEKNSLVQINLFAPK